jgi:hypothetical protein
VLDAIAVDMEDLGHSRLQHVDLPHRVALRHHRRARREAPLGGRV